jgi:hypothetical protein
MEPSSSNPPYAAYAALVSTFFGGIALTAMVSERLHHRSPKRSAFDLAVLGLATFKAARTLARDDVASFIREPFVEDASLDSDKERPIQTGGMRQAVGELVTCPRCVGTWLAAGIAAAEILTPRFGRLLSWSLAIGGVNDWLQAGFSALTSAANRLSARTPAG